MVWTNVAKPTGANWSDVSKPVETSVAAFSDNAEPWGMLIAITKPTFTTSVVTGWTDIQKPVSSTWTLVAKPT